MTEEPHRLSVRVYYEDTDFAGVVYHANYLRFLERGRTEFLRSRGIEQASWRDGQGRPLAFAVRRMEIDFIRPAKMDDLVVVETERGRVGGASLTLHQRILRAGDVLATATVRIAVVSGGRAQRVASELAVALSIGSEG